MTISQPSRQPSTGPGDRSADDADSMSTIQYLANPFTHVPSRVRGRLVREDEFAVHTPPALHDGPCHVVKHDHVSALRLEELRRHHEDTALDLGHFDLPRPPQSTYVLVPCAGVHAELHHVLQMSRQFLANFLCLFLKLFDLVLDLYQGPWHTLLPRRGGCDTAGRLRQRAGIRGVHCRDGRSDPREARPYGRLDRAR